MRSMTNIQIHGDLLPNKSRRMTKRFQCLVNLGVRSLNENVYLGIAKVVRNHHFRDGCRYDPWIIQFKPDNLSDLLA